MLLAAIKTNTLLILLATFSLVNLSAAAQSTDTENPVQHAAETVARIHDSMLEPALFELEAVYLTKPHEIREHKKVVATYVNFCYVYSTHNRIGGYSESRAVEDGSDNNRLSILTDNGRGKFPGYDVGENAPCKATDIDREITADVALFAVPLYQKSK
jgi:hypothetical protein